MMSTTKSSNLIGSEQQLFDPYSEYSNKQTVQFGLCD